MEAPAGVTSRMEPRWLAAALALVCLLVVVGLTWRDAGTYAHTFADERTYSYYARVRPMADAPFPSFLYFKLYSSTQSCGDGALACSRLLNALFFAMALPFIYLLARRFTSWRAALLVTCVTAFSPLNSYTAYFMPESMYFFGVWVLLWLITGESPGERWRPWAIGGMLGLLALVKLHGLFLAPAAGAMVFLGGFGRARLRGALVAGVSFAAALLLVRFGGGFLIAGHTALGVLGAGYEAAAARTPHPPAELAAGALVVLWRHVQAVSVLFALPLAATLTLAPLSSTLPAGTRLDPLRRLQLMTLFFLVPLVLITAIFSAKVAGDGPYELPSRLHLRYYNFLFPLLWVVVAAQFDHPAPWRRLSPRVLLPSLAVLGLGVYGLMAGLDGVQPVVTDAPELLMMSRVPQNFLLCAIAGFLLLAAWAFRPRLAAGLYLFIALPLFALGATAPVAHELGQTRWPTAVDTGSEIARKLLGREGVEHLAVLTSNAPDGFRAIFTLNNFDGGFETLAPGSTFVRTEPNKDWLLVFGDYVLAESHRVVVEGEGFSLVHYE